MAFSPRPSPFRSWFDPLSSSIFLNYPEDLLFRVLPLSESKKKMQLLVILVPSHHLFFEIVFLVACLAWLLLRDVCDWYDSDFTQEGDVPTNSRSAISIRVLLLFVPILAIVDALLNFGLSILILPLFFLKCCYPFKTKLIDARKAGSPHSCTLQNLQLSLFTCFLKVVVCKRPAIPF